MLPADTIASFEDPEFINDWAIVNDTVMGGVSRSRIQQTEEGNLLFSGELSLRNNGGFVSIRSRPIQVSLRGADGVSLRVRGDGRTYYLDLRTGGQRMGGSFRAPFKTIQDEWTEVFIPMTDFFAQSFGRVLRNVRLDPGSVTSIGFTLSDKQPGEFQLEVESVTRVVSISSSESQLDTVLPATGDLVEKARLIIELAISKGVPLFNEGNPGACADVYELACFALLAMPGVSDAAMNRLRQGLVEMGAASSESQKAWILRYALDDTLETLVVADRI